MDSLCRAGFDDDQHGVGNDDEDDKDVSKSRLFDSECRSSWSCCLKQVEICDDDDDGGGWDVGDGGGRDVGDDGDITSMEVDDDDMMLMMKINFRSSIAPSTGIPGLPAEDIER